MGRVPDRGLYLMVSEKLLVAITEGGKYLVCGAGILAAGTMFAPRVLKICGSGHAILPGNSLTLSSDDFRLWLAQLCQPGFDCTLWSVAP